MTTVKLYFGLLCITILDYPNTWINLAWIPIYTRVILDWSYPCHAWYIDNHQYNNNISCCIILCAIYLMNAIIIVYYVSCGIRGDITQVHCCVEDIRFIANIPHHLCSSLWYQSVSCRGVRIGNAATPTDIRTNTPIYWIQILETLC